MVNELLEDAADRMGKSVSTIQQEFVRIRTGRASTSLLDHIQVKYYGSLTPLSQCASVSVQDARTIGVQAWEKNMVPLIEKAILESDLGLNPVTAGEMIRIPLPPMTEERRLSLSKIVRHAGEQGKIAIRNIRRDVIGDIKELTKEKEISEDDEKRGLDQAQEITDQHVAHIDKAVAEKEQEVMEV